MNNLLSRVLAIVLLMGTISSASAQLSILSGLKNGTYEALSNDIKRVSSQEITVLNSNGSVENFQKLMDQENNIYVAFMQYDVLLTNELQNPDLRKNLRILLPLYIDEEIHIIAKKGSGINSLKDLRGKRVAVGMRNQGSYVTAQTIKQNAHIAWIDVEMETIEAHTAVIKGEIDAFIYVGGQPIASLVNLGSDAPIQLVNLKSKALEDLYVSRNIKSGTYPWQTETVTTYAVPTVIVVNIENMSNDTQNKLNNLLLDTQKGLKEFQKNGHPKWQDVYTKNQAIDWPFYYYKPVVD